MFCKKYSINKDLILYSNFIVLYESENKIYLYTLLYMNASSNFFGILNCTIK